MLRLKFLRIERGLSQGQLAELTNIPRPYLSQFESGRTNPRPAEVRTLARTLGCKPGQLLDHVGADSLSDGAEFRDAVRS